MHVDYAGASRDTGIRQGCVSQTQMREEKKYT
ncbi:MAG: hypothetical protein ACI9TH_000915, partial [Kiritimatiellia bacterium]